MTAPSEEAAPLLPSTNGEEHSSSPDLHDIVLTPLDVHHIPDHIHDEPPTPSARKLKSRLHIATTSPGHGHPLSHDAPSPALVLRLRQALDHGFGPVLSAMRARLKRYRPPVFPPPDHPRRRPHANSTRVYAVFAIAIFTMLAMTSVSPSLLLYMNDCGFTSADSIAPYVTASALYTATPIVSNLIMGALADRYGSGIALIAGAVVSALGLLVAMVSRSSLLFFLIGYALYATCNSFRVIRVSLLTKLVRPEDRTTILATHALMTPIGALVGPLVWIAAQTFRDRLTALGGWLIVDRFSITYFVTVLAFGAIVAIAAFFFPAPVTAGSTHGNGNGNGNGNGSGSAQAQASGHANGDGHLHSAVLHFADGHDQMINLQHYRNCVFRFFCGIMLGVNISAGVYMTAFQPVLVNVYHTSDAKLGLIFELIAIFAIIPPLLVAALSRYLKDRQIMAIGLCIKLIGMVLFLPLWNESVSETQVIIGFLLIIKASIFFTTGSLSLFTKLLGSMSDSSIMGVLASASAIGPAVAQIAISETILDLFGSNWFALFAVPGMLSFVAMLWPKQWRRLDPDREFTHLVTHEAELQQGEGGPV